MNGVLKRYGVYCNGQRITRYRIAPTADKAKLGVWDHLGNGGNYFSEQAVNKILADRHFEIREIV